MTTNNHFEFDHLFVLCPSIEITRIKSAFDRVIVREKEPKIALLKSLKKS